MSAMQRIAMNAVILCVLVAAAISPTFPHPTPRAYTIAGIGLNYTEQAVIHVLGKPRTSIGRNNDTWMYAVGNHDVLVAFNSQRKVKQIAGPSLAINGVVALSYGDMSDTVQHVLGSPVGRGSSRAQSGRYHTLLAFRITNGQLWVDLDDSGHAVTFSLLDRNSVPSR
jgi:hypothetical protein